MRVACLLVLAACGATNDDRPAPGPRPERRSTGPLPVAFGDCAGPTIAFVAGPRPLPFDVRALRNEPPVAPPRGDGQVATDPDDDVASAPRERDFGLGEPFPTTRLRAPARLRLGTPEVKGGLDVTIVRRFLRRNTSKLDDCSVKAMLAPSAAGTVRAEFTIDVRLGRVIEVTATGVSYALDTCVTGVLAEIAFPVPRARDAKVAVDLVYAASGAPAPIATLPIPSPPRGRTLFGPAPRMRSGYAPGAANPLRAQRDALTDCLRDVPERRGALVVGFTYDAGGAVASATVDGIADDRVRACIAAAARKVARIGDAPAERCPVAFGETPVAEMHGIDLDDRAIRLDGLDTDARRLGEMLRGQLAPLLAPTGPVIAIHPPLAIRPADATPMAMLEAVLTAVVDAGDDGVLAARRGGEWTLLRPLPSPIPPVPYGTGGTWHPLGRGAGQPLPPTVSPSEPRPQLWLLVTAGHRVKLGVPGRASDDAALGDSAAVEHLLARLKEHKARAFAERSDIELAGEPGASYGDLVAAIDLAAKAGFVDWRIVRADRLAYHFD